jgi:hypothetical protein
VRRGVVPLVQELADSGGAMMDPGAIGRMLELCRMSLAKVDPRVTVESLEDSLMLADVAALFGEVVRVSGLVRGGDAPGEAPGPRTLSVSGAISTATSPRPRAGTSPTSTKNSRSQRRRS